MTSTLPGLQQVTLVEVATPNGGKIEVMGPDEEARYNKALKDYTDGITYTDRSDLEDLERLLFMELMVYRWGRWMMAGKEYDGVIINDMTSLRRMVQDYTDRITKLKESLKLDRKSRESSQAQTFDQRWRQLAEHAKQFGIMREQQSSRAIEIVQGIFAAVGMFDRSDEEERKKLGVPNADAVLDLIREARPQFDEIDEYFRTHQQRFWIRQP